MKPAALLLLLAGCGTAAGQVDAGCGGPFDRACAVAADCVLLNHQLDCCGSEVVLGVAARGADAARSAERACVANGPKCACAARQTVAEDGKVFADAASLDLRCAAGRCESFVK